MYLLKVIHEDLAAWNDPAKPLQPVRTTCTESFAVAPTEQRLADIAR